MDATSFDLIVSVSQDPRLTAAVREIVVFAARYAGCQPPHAAAFGREVEDAVRASLSSVAADAFVPVTVRRHAGPLEVLVDGRTLRLDV